MFLNPRRADENRNPHSRIQKVTAMQIAIWIIIILVIAALIKYLLKDSDRK
jgi:preprotein translocase subunit SecG